MKILAIIAVCFALTGCPGGPRAPAARYVFYFNSTLCFSVDKKDILEYYRIEVNKGGSFEVVANSGEYKLSVSYPHSCIQYKINPGYRYVISYGLNGKDYEDDIFIDNN
ncbi:putative T6SS immunity periplasmic lipoprotein [Pseudescherichia sp.]|uniref:putative T6SS immunity periplasmic lipoprotein n=1 Tax=Pseudescherichia sp. TaxID=2055881 RepID=UPI00289C98D8|nr:putative T6SS immunity periplasmic lipoprotein [Pseudescherichia sp.]